MGTKEVRESLRHNEILVDLPLLKETSNDTGCNHLVRIFSPMYIFSASKSADMSARALKWRPELALAQPLKFGSLNDTLNYKDAKMMFSRQLRWPITYRLVAQLRWSCGPLANTRKATLKPKYYASVKYSSYPLAFQRRWCNDEPVQLKCCWLPRHDREQLGELDAAASHTISLKR